MPNKATKNDFQALNITQMDSPSSQLSNKPSYVPVGQHLGNSIVFIPNRQYKNGDSIPPRITCRNLPSLRVSGVNEDDMDAILDCLMIYVKTDVKYRKLWQLHSNFVSSNAKALVEGKRALVNRYSAREAHDGPNATRMELNIPWHSGYVYPHISSDTDVKFAPKY